MAYGTPSDPVAGTVITVAYAVSNILDPIRWLRLLTGNADPPGSAYVVVSTSTSGTSWQKVPTDAIADGAITNNKLALAAVGVNQIADLAVSTAKLADDAVTEPKIAANAVTATQIANGNVTAGKLEAGAVVTHLGYTPLNKAGDTMGGPLLMPNNVAIRLAEQAGAARDFLKMTTTNVGELGNVNNNLNLIGFSTLQWNGVSLPFPSGGTSWFETLAELTAAGSGWARYTAADGRLLVGAGTTFSQTFVEATNYGSSWAHAHDQGTLATNTVSAGSVASGGGSTATPAHLHTIGGNVGSTTVLLPSRAGVWGRKT